MIDKTLGHYRILEKIGAGGMGVVYKARDEQLERTVAIKLLGESLSSNHDARARLLREARTASALNYPGICTIHEVGEAEGQTYIVMEYVEGAPLKDRIPARGLPVADVVRYGTRIAEALAHAHERGIIHRDLKSANVIILPDGRLKVLDFGLAKRLPESYADPDVTIEALTEAGTILGTLHYMAPEMFQGGRIDIRSDLWALGVLLYEMATGEMPFQGRTAFEVSSAVLREPPKPAPPHVPAGLRAIIGRCLAKEPAERYQQASELQSALAGLLPDTPGRPAPASSRRRWLWGLIPASALGGFAVVKLLRDGGLSGRSGRRLSSGAPASRNAEANDYFEKAMLFMNAQYDLMKGRQMLERALQIDPHFAEARAWYGFTYVLLLESGYSNDTSWLYKAEEEVRRALQDNPDSGRAHSALAAVYIYQGRKELVPDETEKARRINPRDLDAYNWLGNYHWLKGDYAQAIALMKKMAEMDPLFFPARMNLGDLAREMGDLDLAIRTQEKILEQDSRNLYALLYLTRAHMDRGDLTSARKTLELVRPEDSKTYQRRLHLALLLALEGKRAEALREMDEEVLKYAGAVVLITMYAADFYAVLGDVPKALDWLERAVRNGDERIEWFRRDPFLKDVRAHPRFGQIVDSIAFRRKRGQ